MDPIQAQRSPDQMLNAYASVVIDSIVGIFVKEHALCQKDNVDPQLTTHTLISDLKGRTTEIDIRPQAVLQRADAAVDSGIAKLKGHRREVFNLLFQRCLGIMPQNTAGCIQLTEAQGTELQDTRLLKTFVLQTAVQMRQNEIAAILKGVK